MYALHAYFSKVYTKSDPKDTRLLDHLVGPLTDKTCATVRIIIHKEGEGERGGARAN